MDDCWPNHGEYAAGREPFCVKVKAILDAVGIHDVPDASPSTTALAPWFAPTNIETRKHLVSTYQRVADYITSLWRNLNNGDSPLWLSNFKLHFHQFHSFYAIFLFKNSIPRYLLFQVHTLYIYFNYLLPTFSIVEGQYE